MAERYGWAIPILAVGIIIGTILAEGLTSLADVASLGTLGAAIAAFWAVYLNSRDQRRRRTQDEQAQRPHLIISDADFGTVNGEVGEATITFTNLSQHPIHIRNAVVSSDDDPPDVITVGLLVPSSGTVTYETAYNVHFIKQGGLDFIFNYAPTGPVLHSLFLPYKRRHTSPMPEGLPEYPHTHILFMPEDQRLETNVEDRA